VKSTAWFSTSVVSELQFFSPFSGKGEGDTSAATLFRSVRHYLAAGHWVAVGFVMLEQHLASRKTGITPLLCVGED